MIKKTYFFKNGTEQVIPMDNSKTFEEMQGDAKQEMASATNEGSVMYIGIPGEFFQTYKGEMLQSITITKFK